MSDASTESVPGRFPERDDSAAGRKNRCKGGKFLSFFLADEEYGIEILKVQEIVGMLEVTPVPGAPEFVLGVINLRGRVMPVIDLRRKFGMQPAERTAETCIIVVNIEEVVTGVVADRVSEVLDIAPEDVEDAHAFIAHTNTDYLMGIGKSEGRIKILLDIARVLPNHEIFEDRAAAAGCEGVHDQNGRC